MFKLALSLSNQLLELRTLSKHIHSNISVHVVLRILSYKIATIIALFHLVDS